jgi:hypothetical protein
MRVSLRSLRHLAIFRSASLRRGSRCPFPNLPPPAVLAPVCLALSLESPCASRLVPSSPLASPNGHSRIPPRPMQVLWQLAPQNTLAERSVSAKTGRREREGAQGNKGRRRAEAEIPRARARSHTLALLFRSGRRPRLAAGRATGGPRRAAPGQAGALPVRLPGGDRRPCALPIGPRDAGSHRPSHPGSPHPSGPAVWAGVPRPL